MAKLDKGQPLTRRTWVAGGLAVAVSTALTACGGGDDLQEPQDGMEPMASGLGAADFTGNYNYGGAGNPRQVLDLYRAGSATAGTPGPVYIWAHPNGTTYRGNVPSDGMRRQLRDRGVSIISWESHTTLTQDNEAEVTADAYLMLRWVREKGPELGLDPNRIVLGGASRGTFASWKIGHDPAHAAFIKGMFMKQALPGSVACTQQGGADPNTVSGQAPAYWVTAQGPYIKFIHRPTSDDKFHSSHNSQPVMQAYAARGIASKASMVTNATSVGMMDNYLVAFVTGSLGITAAPVASNPGAEGTCTVSGGGGGGGVGWTWPWGR